MFFVRAAAVCILTEKTEKVCDLDRKTHWSTAGAVTYVVKQMWESPMKVKTPFWTNMLLLSFYFFVSLSELRWNGFPFPRAKLMAELLSVIKLIQARCTQLQPCCYLLHVVLKPSWMRGYRCMLSDVPAMSTDKATRLATMANHCQLAGQIFMSQWGPSRTRGPLPNTLAIITPCDHTHIFSL